MFNADELAHYGAEITRLTIVLNTQTKPLAERSTYDRADKGTEAEVSPRFHAGTPI